MMLDLLEEQTLNLVCRLWSSSVLHRARSSVLRPGSQSHVLRSVHSGQSDGKRHQPHREPVPDPRRAQHREQRREQTFLSHLLSRSVSVFPRMPCSHALCLCFPECPALTLCVCSSSVILVFVGIGSGVGQQHRRAVLRPSVCASLQSRLSCLRASGVRLSGLLHMDRISLEEHPSAHLSGGQQRTAGDAAIRVNTNMFTLPEIQHT